MKHERSPGSGVPDGLIKSCLESNCVLFCGQDMGNFSGLPGRSTVIQMLINSGVIPDWTQRELQLLLNEGHVEDVANLLAALPQRSDFVPVLRSLYQRHSQGNTRIERALANIPFCSALGTSWDFSLERIFARHGPI